MCSAEAREPYGREVQPLQSPGTVTTQEAGAFQASAEPALRASQVPLHTHRTTVCSVQPCSKRRQGTSQGAGSEAKPWPGPPGRRDAQVQAQGGCDGHVYLLHIGQLSTAGTEATFPPLWHKYSQTRENENGKYSFCQRSQWVKTPGAAQQGCL